MSGEAGGLILNWSHYLAAEVLVLMRLSGLMVFAPVFSSAAIPAKIKAAFVVATAVLLAPAVAVVPDARPVLDMSAVLGELGVGLVFGVSLSLLIEALTFAGAVLGLQFSFSLVNLMDPNSMIETELLGQMLSWLGVLVIIASGLDRCLLAALIRSFCVVPVGCAVIQAKTGAAIAMMAGGLFLAGLQLAAPVLAASLTVEVVVALVSRLAPQLPAMVMSVPLKTLVSYAVLIASLAVWPGWIERHFTALLNSAGKLMASI